MLYIGSSGPTRLRNSAKINDSISLLLKSIINDDQRLSRDISHHEKKMKNYNYSIPRFALLGRNN